MALFGWPWWGKKKRLLRKRATVHSIVYRRGITLDADEIDMLSEDILDGIIVAGFLTVAALDAMNADEQYYQYAGDYVADDVSEPDEPSPFAIAMSGALAADAADIAADAESIAIAPDGGIVVVDDDAEIIEFSTPEPIPEPMTIRPDYVEPESVSIPEPEPDRNRYTPEPSYESSYDSGDSGGGSDD